MQKKAIYNFLNTNLETNVKILILNIRILVMNYLY